MTKTKRNRFTRLNQPTKCRCCGKGTTTRSGNLDLCQPCEDEAGMENEHLDGYHKGNPVAGCKDCQAEANAALAAKLEASADEFIAQLNADLAFGGAP